ncbi:hypothetical protein CsatA_004147 [Cannabis sativa]
MCLETILNISKTMVLQKSTNSLPTIQVWLLVLVCLSTLSSINSKITSSIPNKIQKGQILNVSQTIVSASGCFELGFFSPQNTSNLYVGIWLFKKRVFDYCVWIANRDYPLITSSAILTINHDGNIVISDGKVMYMVTNISRGQDTYAMLTDSGNLVLKESNSSEDDHNLVWQSFDSPTHSLLTGMTFMWDSSSLVSWKSEADPSPGNFSLILDSLKKQLVIKDRSSDGDSNENEGSMLGMILNKNFQRNLYLGINPQDDSSGQISRLVLDESGQLKLQSCSPETKLCIWIWSRCWYSSCGAYSLCNESAESCSCLPGFKRVDNFTLGDNPISCKRKIELKCSNLNLAADNFFPISTTEFPTGALKIDVGNYSSCQSACLKNCSLIGYAYDEENGCLLWNSGSFFNLRQHSNREHRNIRKVYLRLAAGSEISNLNVISVVAVFLLILCRLLTKQRTFGWKAGRNLLHFDVEMSLRNGGSELPELKKRKKDKADVYSFGVMVLEILSGKKNTATFPNSETRSIIAYAWELWTNDRGLEVMDPLLEDQTTAHIDMALRYIHIALLCVQESAVDRPNISQVAMWLSNSHEDLPQPKQPAFLNSITTVNRNPIQNEPEIISTNFVTLSAIEPRP